MSLIKAENICKAYSEDFSLKDISFDICDKGIYGFLGKRGAGNTSLAKVLAGVSDIDSGRLLYKDVELHRDTKQGTLIKKKIGYVPEKPIFDSGVTAFEILDLIGKSKKIEPDKRYRQIKEALELTGLSLKSEVLTEHLELHEKKRLSMAASLLGNPEVIIWDEPLRFLDSRQAEEIKKIASMLKSRKVVLVFSADPCAIEELCDSIAIMSQGEIALWKSKEELLSVLEENELGVLSDALEAFSCEVEE